MHSITLYGDDNFCDVKELVLESNVFFLLYLFLDIMNVQNVNIIDGQKQSLFNNLNRIFITSISLCVDDRIDVSSKLTDLFKHDEHFQ